MAIREAMVMPVMVPVGRGLEFEDTLGVLMLRLGREAVDDEGAAVQAEDVAAAPWLWLVLGSAVLELGVGVENVEFELAGSGGLPSPIENSVVFEQLGSPLLVI